MKKIRLLLVLLMVPALSAPAQSTGAVQTVIRNSDYSRWSLGLNAGVPFFNGDFNSLSHDKTYLGLMTGIQTTCQMTPMFGLSLSLDWAQNKAGAPKYGLDYMLDKEGNTMYVPRDVEYYKWNELYSKMNMFNLGLHLDIQVNRIFGPKFANSRFKIMLSPAVYLQNFDTKTYTRSGDNVYIDKSLSDGMSVGFGGDFGFRYAVSKGVDLQLKGTGIWITDKNFDNVITRIKAKDQFMWGVSAGVIWKLNHNKPTNLLYKEKKK